MTKEKEIIAKGEGVSFTEATAAKGKAMIIDSVEDIQKKREGILVFTKKVTQNRFLYLKISEEIGKRISEMDNIKGIIIEDNVSVVDDLCRLGHILNIPVIKNIDISKLKDGMEIVIEDKSGEGIVYKG